MFTPNHHVHLCIANNKNILSFLGRVSLWATADPYSNPYAFTLLLFAGANHHRSYCQCTHRSTFKLSSALPLRKAHLFPPKGEPTFCATLVGEIMPLYPPFYANFVFSDIREGHSVPVTYLGWVSSVVFPSLHFFATRYVIWHHITLPRETTTTGL